ncbi:hypothetical protein BVX93_00140, partial [bacterium B13(2017)]
MKYYLFFIILITEALSQDFSGNISFESKALNDKSSYSIAIQPKYYQNNFEIELFARYDSEDDERTYFDVQELNYLFFNDNFELQIGLGIVFWGVTEFVHLVDIINQTNFAENINGEEKLGQPMLHLSIPKDFGVFDFFILPYFRERIFPEENIEATYESSKKEKHIDFAIRYSHSIGNIDFGIYHFKGTSREPTFLPVPFYEQISQTGIDIQLVTGQWLWKLESIYRTGQVEEFLSYVFGYEYTFVGILNSNIDISIIGEYVHDNRGDNSTTYYENDLMLGSRI